MLNYHEMKTTFPCIFEHRVQASQYFQRHVDLPEWDEVLN